MPHTGERTNLEMCQLPPLWKREKNNFCEVSARYLADFASRLTGPPRKVDIEQGNSIIFQGLKETLAALFIFQDFLINTIYWLGPLKGKFLPFYVKNSLLNTIYGFGPLKDTL